MQTPPPPTPIAGPKLEGMAFASFALCITIILSRAAQLVAYVKVIGDIPDLKLDKAPLIIGAVILCFYGWSAVGIWRHDPRGYRRLRNMSLVFGVIQLIQVARTYSEISGVGGELFRELFPSLWLLAIPVPVALIVLHLVTALVAHRAEKALKPADEYLFR